MVVNTTRLDVVVSVTPVCVLDNDDAVLLAAVVDVWVVVRVDAVVADDVPAAKSENDIVCVLLCNLVCC